MICQRCGETKSPMPEPPMSGKWGGVAHRETCAECWRAWVEEQTRLMNHLGLKGWVPQDRAQLYEHMREFLKLTPPE